MDDAVNAKAVLVVTHINTKVRGKQAKQGFIDKYQPMGTSAAARREQ